MIHISLSPNLEPDDVFLALRWLSSPFSWTGKKNQEKLKESLQQLFPQTQAIFLFNAGRSALMLGLKALNLPPGSKILYNLVANGREDYVIFVVYLRSHR